MHITVARSPTQLHTGSYTYVISPQPNISATRIERDYNSFARFCMSWSDVYALVQRSIELMRKESMVLQLRAPIKGTDLAPFLKRLQSMETSTDSTTI